MEKLIYRISSKIGDGAAHEIGIAKFDLDYAYRQLLLSREALNLGHFRRNRGKLHRLLSFPGMALRVSGHIENLLRGN